jgi:hypothetical protein
MKEPATHEDKIRGVTNSDKNTHEEKVLGRKMDCAKKINVTEVISEWVEI